MWREWARGASRELQRRLAEWAADPMTTFPQIHTALEFVLENEPDPDWDLFAVKYGYLELMSAMKRRIPPSAQREIEGEWTFRLGDMSLSPEVDRSAEDRCQFAATNHITRRGIAPERGVDHQAHPCDVMPRTCRGRQGSGTDSYRSSWHPFSPRNR
jgi:hypothetical protein